MKIEEGYKSTAEDNCIQHALNEAAIVGFLGGVMVTLILGALLFTVR